MASFKKKCKRHNHPFLYKEETEYSEPYMKFLKLEELQLESSTEIPPMKYKKCFCAGIEMPWDQIMLPDRGTYALKIVERPPPEEKEQREGEEGAEDKKEEEQPPAKAAAEDEPKESEAPPPPEEQPAEQETPAAEPPPETAPPPEEGAAEPAGEEAGAGDEGEPPPPEEKADSGEAAPQQSPEGGEPAGKVSRKKGLKDPCLREFGFTFQEDESFVEPYMEELYNEFNPEPPVTICGSKTEMPWEDILIPKNVFIQKIAKAKEQIRVCVCGEIVEPEKPVSSEFVCDCDPNQPPLTECLCARELTAESSISICSCCICNLPPPPTGTPCFCDPSGVKTVTCTCPEDAPCFQTISEICTCKPPAPPISKSETCTSKEPEKTKKQESYCSCVSESAIKECSANVAAAKQTRQAGGGSCYCLTTPAPPKTQEPVKDDREMEFDVHISFAEEGEQQKKCPKDLIVTIKTGNEVKEFRPGLDPVIHKTGSLALVVETQKGQCNEIEGFTINVQPASDKPECGAAKEMEKTPTKSKSLMSAEVELKISKQVMSKGVGVRGSSSLPVVKSDKMCACPSTTDTPKAEVPSPVEGETQEPRAPTPKGSYVCAAAPVEPPKMCSANAEAAKQEKLKQKSSGDCTCEKKAGQEPPCPCAPCPMLPLPKKEPIVVPSTCACFYAAPKNNDLVMKALEAYQAEMKPLKEALNQLRDKIRDLNLPETNALVTGAMKPSVFDEICGPCGRPNVGIPRSYGQPPPYQPPGSHYNTFPQETFQPPYSLYSHPITSRAPPSYSSYHDPPSYSSYIPKIPDYIYPREYPRSCEYSSYSPSPSSFDDTHQCSSLSSYTSESSSSHSSLAKKKHPNDRRKKKKPTNEKKKAKKLRGSISSASSKLSVSSKPSIGSGTIGDTFTCPFMEALREMSMKQVGGPPSTISRPSMTDSKIEVKFKPDKSKESISADAGPKTNIRYKYRISVRPATSPDTDSSPARSVSPGVSPDSSPGSSSWTSPENSPGSSLGGSPNISPGGSPRGSPRHSPGRVAELNLGRNAEINLGRSIGIGVGRNTGCNIGVNSGRNTGCNVGLSSGRNVGFNSRDSEGLTSERNVGFNSRDREGLSPEARPRYSSGTCPQYTPGDCSQYHPGACPPYGCGACPPSSPGPYPPYSSRVCPPYISGPCPPYSAEPCPLYSTRVSPGISTGTSPGASTATSPGISPGTTSPQYSPETSPGTSPGPSPPPSLYGKRVCRALLKKTASVSSKGSEAEKQKRSKNI